VIQLSELFKLSEAASIALHSMAYMAVKGGRVTVPEISHNLRVSEAHLSKVLQRLTKNGLVKSIRGPKGGYRVAKPVDEVTLKDIYEAVEGELKNSSCLFQNRKCNSKRCIMGEALVESSRIFSEHLTKTKLSDLKGTYD
jgi:Rrf2 family transcriptional regulator, nitric oxide-sensitive transcriptional repressor